MTFFVFFYRPEHNLLGNNVCHVKMEYKENEVFNKSFPIFLISFLHSNFILFISTNPIENFTYFVIWLHSSPYKRVSPPSLLHSRLLRSPWVANTYFLRWTRGIFAPPPCTTQFPDTRHSLESIVPYSFIHLWDNVEYPLHCPDTVACHCQSIWNDTVPRNRISWCYRSSSWIPCRMRLHIILLLLLFLQLTAGIQS